MSTEPNEREWELGQGVIASSSDDSLYASCSALDLADMLARYRAELEAKHAAEANKLRAELNGAMCAVDKLHVALAEARATIDRMKTAKAIP